MQNAYIPVLMILGFVAFIGLACWLGARASAQARENMRQLAGRLGLELEAAQPALGLFWPDPRISGRIRGKAVALYNYTTGSGKSRHTWSAVAVTPAADGGLTFGISRQGLVTKLQEMFGAREITVGSSEFDATWFVQTNDPDFLKAALLPELLEKFRGFRGAFKMEKGTVTYVESGRFDNEETCRRFESATSLVCDLADLAEVHARHAVRT